jgi:hypothetical protein
MDEIPSEPVDDSEPIPYSLTSAVHGACEVERRREGYQPRHAERHRTLSSSRERYYAFNRYLEYVPRHAASTASYWTTEP